MLDNKISKLLPPLTVISRVIYFFKESLIARVLTHLSSANSLIVMYFSLSIPTLMTLTSEDWNCFRLNSYHSDTARVSKG